MENIKTNIVIFGKNGQVGSNLLKIFGKNDDFNIKSFSSAEVDFSNLKALDLFLENLSPTPNFIINAAAYTAVDKAEEEKELADLINHKAVKIIAEYSAKNNVNLIHYSTDYVFDGSGSEPFLEDNTKNLNPLNHYGKTKLDGENAIINSGCKYIILRTSWVYDDVGKNFVNTIKKLAKEKEILSIIDDQIGSPTSAKYIAESTFKIVQKLLKWEKNFPSGIYHCTSARYISWHDFAYEIVDNLKKENIDLKIKEIKPIKTSEYKTAASRPLNSRLACSKLQRTFIISAKH